MPAVLPFEFVVDGPPISFRCQNRRRLAEWMLRVRRMAEIGWGGRELLRRKVRVVVTYCHEETTARLDNDNMVKPILDAMSGVIYVDDRQASEVHIVSISMSNADNPERQLPALSRIRTGGGFVRIQVDELP